MRVWWSDRAYGDQTGACGNVWREGDATIKAMGMKEGAREDWQGLVDLKRKDSWLSLPTCKIVELVILELVKKN